MSAEDGDDESDLQVKLQTKNEEAERIRQEIQRTKLDAQFLRLQLQAQGVEGDSLIPAEMGSGGKLRAPDLQFMEHKRLIEWLAENIDMSSKTAFNVPSPEVNVGGHQALLGQMVQWALSVPGGLRLSAPVEAERELSEIITKTRSGLLGAEELGDFANDYLLVTTDLVADNVATPALFLIHKESQKATVVSAWPNIFAEPLPQPVAFFDPSAFFSHGLPQAAAPLPAAEPAASTLASCSTLLQVAQEPQVVFIGRDRAVSRLHCPAEGGMWWSRTPLQPVGTIAEMVSRPILELGVSFSSDEEFTVTGPFGFAVIADPPPGPTQRWLVCGLVALALERGVHVQRSSTPTTMPSCIESEVCDSPTSSGRPRSMSSGDQVEVKYKGSWLRGVLQAVQGEIAHVKCDVDENGVITVAPLNRVRLAGDFDIVETTEADCETLKEGFGQA